jgi:hypothetical protein
VHDIRRVADHGAFSHEERMFAIWTTAKRQNGITDREAGVSRDDWVHAKRYFTVRLYFTVKSATHELTFIHTPLKIFEVFELLVRRQSAVE